MTLENLPGKPGETETVRFTTASDGLRKLTRQKAIIRSEDNGSISAWRRDDGKWMAQRYRYRVTQDSIETATKAGLKGWLEEQIPMIF